MDDRIAELIKEPYSRVLIPEEEGGYSAFVLEFPGCISAGDTPDEAMENLTEAMELWLGAVLEEGQSVPTPAEATDYSGRTNLRMPETVHRDAAVRAQIDGVSLNQWIVSAISRALGESDARSTMTDLVERLTIKVYAEASFELAASQTGGAGVILVPEIRGDLFRSIGAPQGTVFEPIVPGLIFGRTEKEVKDK